LGWGFVVFRGGEMLTIILAYLDATTEEFNPHWLYLLSIIFDMCVIDLIDNLSKRGGDE
jgi:hypothetical protein